MYKLVNINLYQKQTNTLCFHAKQIVKFTINYKYFDELSSFEFVVLTFFRVLHPIPLSTAHSQSNKESDSTHDYATKKIGNSKAIRFQEIHFCTRIFFCVHFAIQKIESLLFKSQTFAVFCFHWQVGRCSHAALLTDAHTTIATIAVHAGERRAHSTNGCVQ